MLWGTGINQQPPGREERLLSPAICHGCPATGAVPTRGGHKTLESHPFSWGSAARSSPSSSVTPSRGRAEQPAESVAVQMSPFRPPGWKGQSPRAANRNGRAGREAGGERGGRCQAGKVSLAAWLRRRAVTTKSSPYRGRKQCLPLRESAYPGAALGTGAGSAPGTRWRSRPLL